MYGSNAYNIYAQNNLGVESSEKLIEMLYEGILRFNAQAKKALSKAKRGDLVTIFDINASIIGNSSYKLQKVLPVSIEITN